MAFDAPVGSRRARCPSFCIDPRTDRNRTDRNRHRSKPPSPFGRTVPDGAQRDPIGPAITGPLADDSDRRDEHGETNAREAANRTAALGDPLASEIRTDPQVARIRLVGFYPFATDVRSPES
ncbi:MAG TPA: hypothetical protein DCQ98_12635 [Planctomycetaceae bacterium]|nr:hypothetical protein [Planctomycetaceae bacterium]